MCYKKQGAVFVMFVLFCALVICFYLPARAKQNVKISQKTSGTVYYRGFLVDNVYHFGKNGDIHYNVYFPDSYDGKREMALHISMQGDICSAEIKRLWDGCLKNKKGSL